MVANRHEVNGDCVLLRVSSVVGGGVPRTGVVFMSGRRLTFARVEGCVSLCRCILGGIAKRGRGCLFMSRVRRVRRFRLYLQDLLGRGGYSVCYAKDGTGVLSDRLTARLTKECVRFPVRSLDCKRFLAFGRYRSSARDLGLCLAFKNVPCVRGLAVSGGIVFRCLEGICSAVLLGSIITHRSVQGMSFLRGLMTCLVSGANSLFSTRGVDGCLGSRRIGVPARAVLGCLGTLYGDFFVCGVRQTRVRKVGVFRVNRGCCFRSLKLRGSVRRFSFQGSVGGLVRGMMYVSLLECKCRMCIKGDNGGRVSFVTSGSSRGVCVRMTCVLPSSTAIEQRFNGLLRVTSGCPGCIMAVSRVRDKKGCGKVGRVSLQGFLLTRSGRGLWVGSSVSAGRCLGWGTNPLYRPTFLVWFFWFSGCSISGRLECTSTLG